MGSFLPTLSMGLKKLDSSGERDMGSNVSSVLAAMGHWAKTSPG